MNQTRLSVTTLVLLFIQFTFAFGAQAQNVFRPYNHLGTDEQRAKAMEWNRSHQVALPTQSIPARPFSEVEKTGFVAISGEDILELADLRLAIAKNLPSDVTLVVYVVDESEVQNLQQTLGAYLPADRLKFLLAPQGDNVIWARDSLPFPVYLSHATTNSYGLVGSIYPYGFDPDQTVATALSLPLQSTGQYFRGGNLLFDLNGNCFSENINETAGLSDATTFFKQDFGCVTVTLLDYNGGIGDIDERIKFLSNTEALTDSQSYADLLKTKGYTVHMIPSTGARMETYMNTLLVNGTIFVPQMNIASDKDALAAYQALGFKPVGVFTKQLADQLNGNIHCLTMNYPPGSFKTTIENPRLVEFAH